jgi:hypothetical protein
VEPLHSLSNTEKRTRAVEELIDGVAPSIIAQRYGVTRATVSGWHTPEIHAERDRRRAESAAAGRARLSHAVDVAASALEEIAADPSAPQAARVAAANSILDRAGIAKIDEITVRVEEHSAGEVAAGLLAILGRAQAEIDRAPLAVTAEADPDTE